jgi:hypothetical protein
LIEVIEPKEGSPEPLAQPRALRRFDLSTRPSGYDRYLRNPDGWSRRKAAIAGRESGRRDWADFCHSAFARRPTASHQYRTFFAIGSHVLGRCHPKPDRRLIVAKTSKVVDKM